MGCQGGGRTIAISAAMRTRSGLVKLACSQPIGSKSLPVRFAGSGFPVVAHT